jgi:hypothetical protein|tara:strand:+ start:376 stop:792 length:417 start_codon:yes stop_codon:yes gene_type:complete
METLYISHSCSYINEFSFDETISLDKQNDFINQYQLEYQGNVKEYWIMNKQIISDNKQNLSFFEYDDQSLVYDNNRLLQITTVKPILPFSFFTTDVESEYTLYSSKDTYFLKIFPTYMTFEIKEFQKPNISPNHKIIL